MFARHGKSIALMLTILVVATLFAQPIVISWKSNQLRKLKWTMKTRIIQAAEVSDLISFSFSNGAWANLTKPDPTEFILNGVYYDIAKVENTAEGIIVSCLKDEKEGEIKMKLKRWMKDDHSPYSKAQKSLREFVKVFKFFQLKPVSVLFVCASLGYEVDLCLGHVHSGVIMLVGGPPWLE